MTKTILNFIKKQLNKTTAWIGLVGIFFQLINLYSGLFFLFVALIFLPESSFSETFKKWSESINKHFK